MSMTAKIEKNGKGEVLVITIPLTKPTPSSTGRTLSVATSRGNVPTEAQVNGQPVIVGLNAYIKP